MSEAARPHFETAASSHPGKVRSENEDAFLDGTEAGVWAVADGMGGHHSGQLASRTVVEALRRIAPQTSAARLLAACEDCVVEANNALASIAAEKGRTIGTTLAALLTHDVHYACVWAGDSRIYLVQDGRITLVSRDHTEVRELVDRGVLTEQESRASPRRNVITRAIGVAPEAELEIAQGLLLDGDTFLLCSDGLTNHVADVELLQILSGGTVSRTSRALVDLAIERGGLDNVTAVVVRYHAAPLPCLADITVLDPVRR